MKPFEFKIKLAGPTGDKELWTIKSGKLRYKSDYGYTNWQTKTLTLNYRLRNQWTIFHTLLHELMHVTGGQNWSEEFCINLENNIKSVHNRMNR